MQPINECSNCQIFSILYKTSKVYCLKSYGIHAGFAIIVTLQHQGFYNFVNLCKIRLLFDRRSTPMQLNSTALDRSTNEGLRERTEYIDIFLFFRCLLVEGECQILMF